MRVVHRETTLCPRRIALMLAVATSLAAWTLWASKSPAQSPPPSIPDKAGATLGARDPAQLDGSTSDEIWISSDDPLPPPGVQSATKPSVPESTRPAKTQSPRPGHSEKSPGGIEDSDPAALTASILRSRSSSFAGSSPNSEARSPQRPTLSEAALALDKLLAEQPVATQPSPKPTLKPMVEEGDDALFRTTSAPVRPAALLWAASAEQGARDAAQASRQDAVSALQMPARPTSEPDAQVRLRDDQSSSETPSQETAAATGAGASAAGADSTRTARDELPDWSGQAVRARSGRPVFKPPVTAQPEPALADSSTADGDPVPKGNVRHVVLRIRLAELNRKAGGPLSMIDLGTPRRPPLMDLLLEAESEAEPILVDSSDADAFENQLQDLVRRGVLEMRGQPTLVTTSGRPARLGPSVGRSASATTAGIPTAATSADLPVDVTLLPTVFPDEQIQLQAACKPSGPPAGTDDDESPARTTRGTSASVRMRAGQTLVIVGLGQDASQDDRQRLSLASVLRIGKSEPKQPELVMLITPELIGSPGSKRPVAVASRPQTPSLARREPASPAPSREAAPSEKPSPASKNASESKNAPESKNPVAKLWGLSKEKVSGLLPGLGR